MIGATRRWFQRHRRSLAIGVGVVGVGYLAGQYVLSKISEARERLSSDRIAKENLRRRFEQNQADCTFTVLALLPTAAENIIEALPVEELTQELQRKRAERLARLSGSDAAGSEISSVSASVVDENDTRSLSSLQTDSYVHASQVAGSAGTPTTESADGAQQQQQQQPKRSRAQLWNDVKITALTRSIVLIYTLSLLTLFTRIQLNLLGRRNYLSSVVSLASPASNTSTIRLEDNDDEIGHAFGNDFDTNRRYLTFSWWLLHRGWKDLMEKVRTAVIEVFGSVNPRDDITLSRFAELILEVRKKVEGATDEERREHKLLPYLLPPREEEDTVLQESGVLTESAPSSPETAANLRHLLDETSDLIESPTFTRIFTLLNNEGFSMLVDRRCAQQAFKSPASPAPVPESFASVATVVPGPPKAKLATVLAVVTREAHNIGHGPNPPNDYLTAMEQNVRELEAFAAVVYSSNFELDLVQSVPSSSLPPTTATNTSPSTPAAQVGGNSPAARPTQPATSTAAEQAAFASAWEQAQRQS